MKVIFFVNQGDYKVIEKEINEWLKTNSKITIENIKQNYAYGGELFYTMVSVWYVEKSEFKMRTA
ncbi:MAG: hypothetical protein ABIJ25_11115 [Pseudomonadota bacterium]